MYLIIQQLYREILAVADEMGGKLKNRCVFYCDELEFKISSLIIPLTFDEDLCELYNSDDGISWALTLNDGKTVNSSE